MQISWCVECRFVVPGGNEVNYEEVRVLYRKWFGENPFYHVKPFEGIVTLLEALKQQGIKIAVFSNKPHEVAVEVVHKIFGEQMFHKIQGQTAQIPRKAITSSARWRLPGNWE